MADSAAIEAPTRARTGFVYGLMIAVTAALYLLICQYGERLMPPAARPSLAQTPVHSGRTDEMLHVLMALAVVIVLARLLGVLFRRLHQPPVVGEILAGIMLGPSLLGRFAPETYHYLLPASVAPFLNVLSQVGVILYMFLVGLELDPKLLRQRGHSTVAISHASIVVPFLLGAILALFIYPMFAPPGVTFTPFSLFLGASMSVTAFPVLARILTDRGMHKTRMGAIALTCAAVDDISAWCLLAFVVGVVEARTTGALMTAAMALAYVAFMIVVARPAMARLALVYGNRGRLTQGLMATLFVALLLSSLATDLIGIHPVFGAFALGAAIPHDSELARELTDRLEDLVVVLLLPAFFAFTGLRTQIGLVQGTQQWLICAAIILIASLGKFGGSAIAARATGIRWRDAAALGVLMNTRGLMELIVLNIGLELHVISPALFAMLVLMALVTTFATTPMLALIASGDRERTQEVPTQVPIGERPAILVPISNPEGVGPLVDLALAATATDETAPRVLALVRRQGDGVRSGLRELEARVAPRAASLSAAIERAVAREAAISPQIVWTQDPAADIVRAARESQPAWLLLGSHRPVFGHDFRGGVVRQVLDKARELPVDIGVLLYGHSEQFTGICAVMDDSPHGIAAIEFASRIARKRHGDFHALVALGGDDERDERLLGMFKSVGQELGSRLHIDVLAQRKPEQLNRQISEAMVIIACNLVEELGLPIDPAEGGHRQIVVVQSGAHRPSTIALNGNRAESDDSVESAS